MHLPFAAPNVMAGNLHSVYREDRVLTGGLWDHLATLPSLVPPGPIAMLGLAAGTVPQIMASHYPCGHCTRGGRNVVHGWELDPAVVEAGRLYLGMHELEQRGELVVHIGDALAPTACVPGGFSGIIVDLFAGGRLLPQLTKASPGALYVGEHRKTWEDLRSRLAPGNGARLIANLGQAPPTIPGVRWQEEAYTTLRAYEALEAAFDGEVSLLTVQSNTLALTGPLPNPEEWPGPLPEGLQHLAADGLWARDVYPLQKVVVNLSLW
ncbi:hypothetical protein GPECTOR_32g486 [Gonium pectorale]|uniref:PABS domain-containing protein n=1 Tax=Gonium pectorale TaxID=33097 RepID=A0A150GDM2_GONPE|nr:hypothetical protein GPECTOR_32g486 [Gonium pectorale]|eukprot:KXZ47873.1 hypothetical protein GPECTOR_32g486 [Gonium pectorale]